MAKKIVGIFKFQLPAGKADASPLFAPTLARQGVNVTAFCREFNAKTASQEGHIVPALVTIYADRSFAFDVKQPAARAA
jgi:large subunit ribosomal protein L11